MVFDSMEVSVLMPVYNAERYLAEAVESILDQTFADFEFLIVDDGSTDRSLSILQGYAATDSRVRLYSRHNTGLVATLNELIEKARAPYLVRMDADDISMPWRIEKQIEYMESNPDCVASSGFAVVIDPDGDELMNWELPVDHNAIDQFHMQGHGGGIIHPASILRARAVRLIGGYLSVYPHAEDFDLWLRLAEHGKLGNISIPILKYRHSEGSVSSAYKLQQLNSTREAILRACERRRIPVPASVYMLEETNLQVKTKNPDLYVKWAWWALDSKHVNVARKHAFRAFFQRPFDPDIWRVLACSLRGY